MDHNTLKSKLYEFYDGELSEEESQLFSIHLLSCRECQLEIELLKKTALAYFKKPEIQISEGFSEKLMDRIREKIPIEQKSKHFSFLDLLSLPRWEIATALSMFLLIFSYFSMDYIKSGDTTEPNPMALIYEQSERYPWLFSEDEVENEDLLEMTIGNGDQEESGFEEIQ